MSRFRDVKGAAWHANLELSRLGLAVGTFGNASALDRRQGVFAIKPSGVEYRQLRADDMVVVDLTGSVVEGTYRPSSDTPTHAVLYRNFPAAGGIVHTHSPYAVAWAQARRAVPILGTTHADHLPGDIPCTQDLTGRMIAGDYEEETGNLIVRRFRKLSPVEVPMVLVARHGPFAWGETPEKALWNAFMLEELARMASLTLHINPRTPRLPGSLIRKHYMRKHGPGSTYGQGDPGPGTGGTP